jgi:tripartite-type tricarboxylate transporter receptor subunit TctC
MTVKWQRFLCAVAAVAWAGCAGAQNFPSKPVRVVVPYAAGGLPDTMTRLASVKMIELFGQQVVVDNRPGAGGIGACELVAHANPDGYTLLIVDVAQTAINPALYAKLPYDTLRDFAPVSLMGTSAQFLSANASVPANTLLELIKLAKAKPGQLRYGSGGIGSVHHLSMEALKTPLGLDIVHVPYKGNGQAIPAMIGGEVALVFSALPAIEGHLKSGRVKLLAVNTLKRSPQAPNVPTVSEVTGIKDYDYPPAIGVLAPAKTPRAVILRVAEAVSKAVNYPDIAKRYIELGIDPVGNTPEQYAAQIRVDIAKYAKAVKASGVKVE